MLNRCAVIVRPKEPFFEWLRSLPDMFGDSDTMESIHEDSQVYLLPEYDNDTDQVASLNDFADIIFESELEAWWTNEVDWPAMTT